MTGVQVLKPQFGTTLVLVVEAAFGADLTDLDGSGWTWTDITADVFTDGGSNGVSYTVGKGDEASTTQPASCTFTLDDRNNRYNKSPLASHYPYIKPGTPIRVRLVLSGTSYTRFQGSATKWQPTWSADGKYAAVAVQANGTLQRLAQADDPVQSSLRHSIPSLPNLAAYWPMEDLDGATSISSAFPNTPTAIGTPMAITGTPDLSSSTPFPSSAALPTLKDGYLLGRTPVWDFTGATQVRFIAQFPASGSAAPDQSSILRFWTYPDHARWDLIYLTGGALRLTGFSPSGGLVHDSGAMGFAVDGKRLRVGVSLANSGSNVAVQISTYEFQASFASYINKTITGYSVQATYAVAVSPGRDQSNLVIGHLTVETAATDIFDLIAQFNAYGGETAGTRFSRLCAENSIDAATSGTLTTGMGNQTIDTVLNLLRECETANFGMIQDGAGPGLKFLSRTVQENEAAGLTIDASAGELDQDFAPVDDNQLLRNQWTITRKSGGTAVAQDTTGPLGVNNVGPYKDSKTVNLADDDVNQSLASWLVHEFTIEGYRFPQLVLNFHAIPTKAAAWLAMGLWGRIDITNLADVVTQALDWPVSVLVQGYTETVTQSTWTAEVNASPYDPWRCATLITGAGDTSEFLMRPDTDGSSVHTTVSAGATSISVDTPSGPLWTTTADDFPLYANIGGLPVKVTNITGASSPQTFTVDGTTVTKSLTSGTSVSVWRPTALAIP